MTRAGELDRRVELQENQTTRDATGAAIDVWTTVATVWASRYDQRGREFFASNHVVGESATIYRIRWRAGVHDGMAILDAGERWDIRSHALLGRRHCLELHCIRLES